METPTGLVESVLDNLPVAIFAKDATDSFRFVLWNKKQESITTLKAERALGKTDFELFAEDSASYFRKVDETVMKRGKLLEVPEEIIETKSGEIHLRTVKFPVVDPESGRLLLVGISEDITEKVRAEEQLERLNRNLSQTSRELQDTQMQLIQAEKLESIGRLAAGVAHEVKNPLAMLLLGVDYLSQQPIDPEDVNLEEILTQMREAVNRADRIVRGLVDLSSDRSLSRVEAQLADVVEEVLLLTRHELVRGSVSVDVNVPRDLPPVFVDMSKFEQVLINLVINAVHAMEETDRPALEIHAHTTTLSGVPKNQGARTYDVSRDGDRVVILEIRDNGSGIEEENLSKLFDPFYTTKATGRGTGLGLSVVHKIVELHGGKIEITNRSNGSGASVTLTLPSRCTE